MVVARREVSGHRHWTDHCQKSIYPDDVRFSGAIRGGLSQGGPENAQTKLAYL